MWITFTLFAPLIAYFKNISPVEVYFLRYFFTENPQIPKTLMNTRETWQNTHTQIALKFYVSQISRESIFTSATTIRDTDAILLQQGFL